MMKTLLIFTGVMIFAVSVAFAQAGPKQNEPAKRDTTKAEEKKAEEKKTEEKKAETKKAEAKKAEEKKTGEKKAEAKKIEEKKVEAKKTKEMKAEKKKAEATKAEPKKTEAKKSQAPVVKKTEPAKPESPPQKKANEPAKQPAKPVKVMESKMVEGVSAPSNHIKRAVFATAIEDREPVGRVDSLTAASGLVYFFTEIVGFEGHTVTHRWSHGDKVLAEVPFEINGPRWRVYSSKKILPSWSGRWTVEVVDDEGKVHLKRHLNVY